MSSPEKWDWTMTRIAWIDVETDGLVRPGCRFPLCLEVALVVTDGGLNELSRFEAVIAHPEEVLDALDPHPVVKEMHQKSGLWEALRGPDTMSLKQAEDAMVVMLDGHCGEPGERQGPDGVDTRPVVWGGFSPAAIDRPVLARYMPTFYKRIHHRSVDVSALKLAMLNWAGVRLPETKAVHRAMDDTLESISVARIYATFLDAACRTQALATIRSHLDPQPVVAAAG